ncbi:hypothetical protein FHS41_008222 [Streptomyces violarus]|uniref:Uncharacterized protein n=1 Tax=Streptomyces violarus TaxID=67380 RepID=A0A7W5F6M3_9ACTN|nr:hypothetical protein [Streptomyces violarus]MBB3081664.1 hypothetical protein [Streptomyces violarus]
MELSAQAVPGVEKAAEQAVESACHLADLAVPNGWSTAAAEDVLDAIDTLTETLGGAGAELAQALAAVSGPPPLGRAGTWASPWRVRRPSAIARCRSLYRAARSESRPGVADSGRASGASVRTADGRMRLRLGPLEWL